MLWKPIKQLVSGEWGPYFTAQARKGWIFDEGSFEQRTERGEEGSHTNIVTKSIEDNKHNAKPWPV